MWSKILKVAIKYGSKAVAWAWKNRRWLLELGIDVVINILFNLFG